MKIKIEVDLEDMVEDMLGEGEADIKEELKSTVIRSVINKLLPKMQKTIDVQIVERLDSIITARVEASVQKTLDKAIDDGTIVKHGETISIKDHVTELFQKSHGWDGANSKIASIAKAFGKELKLQYNNAFATQVVVNMKDQGLLKDDVVKILLESPQPTESKS